MAVAGGRRRHVGEHDVRWVSAEGCADGGGRIRIEKILLQDDDARKRLDVETLW